MGIRFLLIILSAVVQQAFTQEVRLYILDDTAYFLEQKDSILAYRAADVSFEGNFTRSNYVHPLYNLNGTIITQDFPEDHRHHRGLFWAWHQLYVDDTRIGDGWELKDFNWDVVSMGEINVEKFSTNLKTQVLWKSPMWVDNHGNQKPLVKETTTISVYPKVNSYRVIDFKIELLALEPNMRIGGSKDEKGYGGFSVRMKLPNDVKFRNKAGKVIPENLPVEGPGWLTIEGTIGEKEAITGVTIIPHQDNPGYPNPWILRSKSSMQNAVYPDPGAIPIPLSTTIPTLLQYRLLISRGKLDQTLIEKSQEAFFQEK